MADKEYKICLLPFPLFTYKTQHIVTKVKNNSVQKLVTVRKQSGHVDYLQTFTHELHLVTVLKGTFKRREVKRLTFKTVKMERVNFFFKSINPSEPYVWSQ